MKRLLLSIGFVTSFGMAVLATTQYQNIGTVTMSTSTVTGGMGLWVLPKATIQTLTPVSSGTVVFCQDCVQSNLCVSTSVATGGNDFVSVSTGIVGCK